MRHLTVTNKRNFQHSGFTLIEVLVVVLLLGIMSIIGAPGMLGFLRRSKVSAAESQLQGALQEIQREAIKRGRDCSITFPASNAIASNQTGGVLKISSNCLLTGDLELEQVRIRHNLPSTTINLFNFRGETDSALSSDAVIIFSQEDNYLFQKCIAISDGLGLIRIGNYATNDSSTTVSQCTPTS